MPDQLIKPNDPEIGRVLAVNELKPPQVVWLQKAGRPQIVTMWAVEVTPTTVLFYSGVSRMHFLARRCGESITDEDGAAFGIYEYLGKENQ